MKLVKDTDKQQTKIKITDLQAEEAFKTILKWIGEDPSREGLLETPKRVLKHLKNISKDTIKIQQKNLKKLLVMLMGTMTWL